MGNRRKYTNTGRGRETRTTCTKGEEERDKTNEYSDLHQPRTENKSNFMLCRLKKIKKELKLIF